MPRETVRQPPAGGWWMAPGDRGGPSVGSSRLQPVQPFPGQFQAAGRVRVVASAKRQRQAHTKQSSSPRVSTTGADVGRQPGCPPVAPAKGCPCHSPRQIHARPFSTHPESNSIPALLVSIDRQSPRHHPTAGGEYRLALRFPLKIVLKLRRSAKGPASNGEYQGFDRHYTARFWSTAPPFHPYPNHGGPESFPQPPGW